VFALISPGDLMCIVLDGGPSPPGKGRQFNVAFAKLLWPLVVFSFLYHAAATNLGKVSRKSVFLGYLRFIIWRKY